MIRGTIFHLKLSRCLILKVIFLLVQLMGVFYSQIVRLFRANNNLLGFINNVKAHSEKLCNQNFNKANLFHQLNLFSKAYRSDILGKFWHFISAKDFY